MTSQKDLITEIATRARSVDFWAMWHYLPNPDPVLKAMGKDISCYRELLSDPHLSGCVRRRKAAIKGLEWRLTPTGNVQVDEQLNTLFSRLPLNRIINELLDASLFGYQALEILWQKQGNVLLPVQIIGKPQEWFVFDTDNRLRLRTKENFIEGELLPERKFLLASQDATYTNPYGSGDLSKCFWAATFKKGGFKFWLEFTEKYGAPWLIGKHPRNASLSEKERLADALEGMIGTAIAVVPDDAKVEILESASKGASSQVHSDFLKYCKAEIAIALLGQNQTTEAEANRASSQAGLEVVEDIRNADAEMVASVFNQLLAWVCELNFNVDTLPTFELYEQESIDKLQAERDKILADLGVQFTEQYVQRTYNLEQGDFTLVPHSSPCLRGEVPKAEGGKIDYTEPHHAHSPLDAQINQLGEQAQAHIDEVIQKVKAKLDQAESLSEFQAMLDSFIPELSLEQYAQLLAEGMTSVQLQGRYEVQQEAKARKQGRGA